MPIEYESAAPISLAASIYQQAARRAQPVYPGGGGPGYGGGYGGGYGHGGGYDDGSAVQAAIFGRDDRQFAREQDALNRTGVTASQAFAANAANAHQEQEYQLRASLESVSLTQQENMRLQRMKNAIGEVTSDSTLSAGEKNDLIVQLRTGIDPLEKRQVRQRMESEKMQKEAMAEQYQAQAALRNQEATVTAKSAHERTTFLADPKALAEISDDIAANADLPPMTPEARDELIGKMAQEEALRQGLGHHAFQAGYNKWEFLSPNGPGTVGKDGGGAGAGGKATGYHDIGPADLVKIRHDAAKRAHAELTETYKAAPGAEPKRVRDVAPDDVEKWVADRTEQIVTQDLAAIKAHSAEKPQAPKYGYDPARAGFRARAQVATVASGAQPSSAAASASQAMATKLVGELNGRTDLDEATRLSGAHSAIVMRRLLGEAGGNPDKLTGEKRAEYDKAKAVLAKIPAAPPPTQFPAAPPAAPQKPWWQKLNDGDYGRDVIDIPSVLGTRRK